MINLISSAGYTMTIGLLSHFMFDTPVTMVQTSYLFIGWMVMCELTDIKKEMLHD